MTLPHAIQGDELPLPGRDETDIMFPVNTVAIEETNGEQGAR